VADIYLAGTRIPDIAVSREATHLDSCCEIANIHVHSQ
jgi:hypothetical protein